MLGDDGKRAWEWNQGLWSGRGRWMGVRGRGEERREQWRGWEQAIGGTEVAQARQGWSGSNFDGHGYTGYIRTAFVFISKTIFVNLSIRVPRAAATAMWWSGDGWWGGFEGDAGWQTVW